MDSLSYFTDRQVTEIVKSLVFLVDTREKENSHILQYFDNKKVTYQTKALESGDYSVLIPPNPDFGILVPQTFNKPIQSGIFIERKNSLEELAGNLGRNRDRFEAELERMKGAEKHLIIEDGSWEKIIKGEYNSLVTPLSYFNSLLTFQSRYGLHIHFVDKRFSGSIMRGILENKVKEVYQL